VEILAIVPARGGSKSIPRKNIRPLLGQPLIAWIIGAAKRSRRLTRLIVSTDDPEIAGVARGHGAEVPFLRPAEIAQDLSTDVEFLLQALDWLDAHESYVPEIVLRLPPTSPLTTAAHIDEGIRTLLETPGADAVRPIVEVTTHPYKMWTIAEEGRWLTPFLPKEVTGVETPHDRPRQLFPPVYRQTGAMDVMWRRTVRDLRSTSGRRLAYFFMAPEDSVNIDQESDFAIAECFLRRRLEREADGGSRP
jgi:N-acylneuraminate cytidylyltransferase